MATTKLTVFTPTFNRAHTLRRLYDSLTGQTCKDFEWLVIDDGSTDNTRELIDSFIAEKKIAIRYIYKENGGLYTGYNTAYANIETELCVCVDSDDYMPLNAVELILDKWEKDGSAKYAGIVGLDFYAGTDRPIAGFFPEGMTECYYLDIHIKNIHRGDSKYVFRTELMKAVAPQKGFEGEKDFNPVYMMLQVCDDYPVLVLNRNLCFVDYQPDGMASNIFRQYMRSPRSFAKLRLLEMSLKRSTVLNNFRCAVHLVSECLISGDKIFRKDNPQKLLTFFALFPGWLWWRYILYRNKKMN